MPNISLYVCCHKPFPVPAHPLLCPIQVGAALSDTRIDNWLHDDEGDNISLRNRAYCELTAQYWAWKNSRADYLGFFHYRRYFYPEIGVKLPYIVRKEPTPALLDQLHFDDFFRLIERYDIIVPIGEDMHIPVRLHYANAPHHRAEDLALVEQIVREKHPAYAAAMEEYLGGTMCYFGNMFIMRRAVFHEYCAWLFPILEEFDCRADWTGRSAQELRADGYLAERLFGAYLTHRQKELSVLHLPRVHFEPEAKLRMKQNLIHALLPPGSKKRARVKRIVSLRSAKRVQR